MICKFDLFDTGTDIQYTQENVSKIWDYIPVNRKLFPLLITPSFKSCQFHADNDIVVDTWSNLTSQMHRIALWKTIRENTWAQSLYVARLEEDKKNKNSQT
jgi:hypothetical protein